MNKEFKKIAKQLGIAIPACLLSISVAKADNINENMLQYNSTKEFSEIAKNNFANNAVVKFLTTDISDKSQNMTPDHTDFHTNAGGNHADRHSNLSHNDYHSNRDARTENNQCKPHSDSHTNRDGYNTHTNSGNKNHTDSHTNRNNKFNC